MPSVGLEDFVLFLNRQTRASFRGSSVDTYLAQHQIDLAELTSFCRFREDTYARNLVYSTALYELLVLAWLPGHRAAVHDHAGQRCWMTIVSGELTVQNYEPLTVRRQGPPAPSGDPIRISATDVIYTDDRLGLHSIRNSGRIPAVSMHLYAGPIPRCHAFDENLQRFKQVELLNFPSSMEWNPGRPKDLV